MPIKLIKNRNNPKPYSLTEPNIYNETIISIPLTKSNEHACDSFITIKKQLCTDEKSFLRPYRCLTAF